MPKRSRCDHRHKGHPEIAKSRKHENTKSRGRKNTRERNAERAELGPKRSGNADRFDAAPGSGDSGLLRRPLRVEPRRSVGSVPLCLFFGAVSAGSPVTTPIWIARSA
ncbi:MAG: hypothetical protein AUH43_16305 [Acidobacteria bacterium 13_1_40CM_65_14]|nr:MAG: hypothetical protein AUH43_16305 [Acidobacteria bacterium 13_1_40CM_65_14]